MLRALFTSLLLIASAAANPLPRSLWIWDATTITDPAKRTSAFELCQRHGISVIFISTGSVFAPDVPSRPPVSAAQLAQFNLAASAIGIDVHALDGDPSHALAANHQRVLNRFTLAINFNHTQPPEARLRGFQWNIEPYVLAQWRNDPSSHPEILHQFLTLVEAFAEQARNAPTSLPLGFALPFWFDDPARSLAFKGVSLPPTFHIMRMLQPLTEPYIALMSYRDTVSGPNSTLSITADERAYAAAHTPNVSLWIGQETGPFDPPHITFAQEGPAALDAAVLQLTAALANEAVVAGVAIHQIAYYRAMLEAQPRLGDRILAVDQGSQDSLTLRFSRASRDRCVLESSPDLSAGSWKPLATYDPALLRWTLSPSAPADLTFAETIAPTGLVSVQVALPRDGEKNFFRVRAE
jgi:hypothetical protein